MSQVSTPRVWTAVASLTAPPFRVEAVTWIALVPGRRSRGIGSALLRDLLAEAAAAGKPVRIHVEQYNQAMRLYRRLGFVETEEHGVYRLMEWRPRPASAHPA